MTTKLTVKTHKMLNLNKVIICGSWNIENEQANLRCMCIIMHNCCKQQQSSIWLSFLLASRFEMNVIGCWWRWWYRAWHLTGLRRHVASFSAHSTTATRYRSCPVVFCRPTGSHSTCSVWRSRSRVCCVLFSRSWPSAMLTCSSPVASWWASYRSACLSDKYLSISHRSTTTLWK